MHLIWRITIERLYISEVKKKAIEILYTEGNADGLS